MNKMSIHHIGYAVENIEDSLKTFLELGYTLEKELVIDKNRQVNIIFITNNNVSIELLSPLSGKSPISNILSKNGPLPYHICYETEKLEETIQTLKKKGFINIEKPQKSLAINDCLVAFLYHKNVGLIELVETK